MTRTNREMVQIFVFYFLVGNVFFLSLLSGSLLDELGQSFSHPRDFPSRLARAVAAQADFFTTYILTDGLSGFSLELLQAGLLTWNAIKTHTYGRGKKSSPYLFSLPYFRVIPFVCLSLLIGMVYALVAPLLLPFVVGYLYFGYAVYINQNAGEADELDEKDGRLEINSENAARAYCPPFLTPISSNEAGSSSNHSATS
uniref:CSC1/OSCA1-like 7TM region domain-containing protein n=1 Tax=Opuntia streptacantha TaxID=393608 RepID=A0A7C9B2Y0_OPUST